MADIKHLEYEGYKFDVDLDAMDDVEFLTLADEAMVRGGAFIDIAKLVFGKDGYEKLKAYFVKKDGKLKVSTLKAIFDIVLAAESPKE